MGDTGMMSLRVPTVVKLKSPDSVSMMSTDSQHQLPYQMMLDDSTSVGRDSYSDTEGLLGGEYQYLFIFSYI